MKAKQLRLIITFHTTTAAMGMERACMDAGIPGRLIPVPREITAGCGMAWSAPPAAKAELEAFVQARQIPCAEWHELML